MTSLRAFLLSHRAIAMLVIAAALCLKLVVPTGYMIGTDTRVLTIQICNDGTGHTLTTKLVVPLKQSPADQSGKSGKAECPYSSLGHASLAGADPVQLALALAFIIALGFAAVAAPPLKRAQYLLPPLRGPPALA